MRAALKTTTRDLDALDNLCHPAPEVKSICVKKHMGQVQDTRSVFCRRQRWKRTGCGWSPHPILNNAYISAQGFPGTIRDYKGL